MYFEKHYVVKKYFYNTISRWVEGIATRYEINIIIQSVLWTDANCFPHHFPIIRDSLLELIKQDNMIHSAPLQCFPDLQFL